jgi:hypothetical protein
MDNLFAFMEMRLMKRTLTRRFNSSLQSYEAKLWIVFEHTNPN